MAAILVNAIFDPTLEGPQVAWWLWGILGLGVAIVTLDQAGRLPALALQEPSTKRERVEEPVSSGTDRSGP